MLCVNNKEGQEKADIMVSQLKPLVIGDLEIKVPIIQGAMGVMVSRASLASAVANCGGAGTIASVGLGYGTKENESNFVKASREGLLKEIRKAKELTRGVFGVNIMVALSNYEDLILTAVKEKVSFIISGAGLPLKLPEFVNDASIKLIPIVSSARAADIIIRTWKKRYNLFPDAIVVEGPMAGGHLGFKSEDLKSGNLVTLEDIIVDVIKLVKEYEKGSTVNIPVIAAGGIFDGKDVARFLRLGADGVQIATRFVTTFECSVADEFKQLYINAKEEDIVIIDSPVGMPGRAIKTIFTDKMIQGGRAAAFACNYQCLRSCNPKTAPYCIAKALFNSVSGNLDEAIVFAGSNVSRVKEIVSVKDLIDEIVSETIKELDNKQ